MFHSTKSKNKNKKPGENCRKIPQTDFPLNKIPPVPFPLKIPLQRTCNECLNLNTDNLSIHGSFE